MRKLGLLVLISSLSLASCTDAKRSKMLGHGSTFKVELINCDGTVAKTWISTGKVSSEASSDGYFFKDSESGNLVEVTGTIIITEK